MCLRETTTGEKKRNCFHFRFIERNVNSSMLFFLNKRKAIKLLIYMLCYITLLMVSSAHVLSTVVVNFVLLLVYFYKFSNQEKHAYLFVLAAGNCTVLYAMINTYGELLPWELWLHALFYAISLAYLYYSTNPVKDIFFFIDNKLYATKIGYF